MIKESIYNFLVELGVNQNDIQDSGRGWVNSPCPLAEFTHESGKDSHPSFGVSINDEGQSAYYCFGCHPEPSLLRDIVVQLFLLTKEYPYDLARLILDTEIFKSGDADIVNIMELDAWKGRRTDLRDSHDPLPDEVLRHYPLLSEGPKRETKKYYKYFSEQRHIPSYVVNHFNIRYDEESDTVLYPLTNRQGDIYMLRQRSIHAKKMWTVSERNHPGVVFPRLKFNGVWFGMHLVDMTKPLMVLESEMDVMRLHSLSFPNAVASATSSVTRAQMDALYARTIYLAYDSDKAGKLTHKRIMKFYRDSSSFVEIDWSVVGCKDPGELKSQSQLRTALSSGVLL